MLCFCLKCSLTLPNGTFCGQSGRGQLTGTCTLSLLLWIGGCKEIWKKIRQIEGKSALPHVHEFFRLLNIKWNFCLLFHEDPDDGFDGDFQTQSDDAAADPLQLERQGHCWETRKLLEYLQQAMENCHFCKASW